MSNKPASVTPNTQVRSVGKALAILDLFAGNGREMSLAEIAKATGLAKSTLHDLLATLKEYRYVEQDCPEGKYRLGIRLFELGNAVANTWDVRRVAAPVIERLADEFGETVHLAVLDQDRVLYIDKHDSRGSIRIVSQVGARLPAHCSGVSKILLAALPTEEVCRIASSQGLAAYTANTITGINHLNAELELIRQRGYSVDNEEIMDGLRCVAAPVQDHRGQVCAGVSISGPVARLTGERFDQAVQLIKAAAAEISSGLGFRVH